MNSVPTTAPVFQSLGRRSAYLEVAERIRATIFKDKLALFQRMPSERDLAAQFGVSRVVVREAIRTLETSGLVTVKKGPKGGIFVTQDYERPIVDTITNLLAGGEATLDDLFEMRLF
jgi:GntR family transcriptional regulator, transcriptional repressor for pyruvate dehydrogenase complex